MPKLLAPCGLSSGEAAAKTHLRITTLQVITRGKRYLFSDTGFGILVSLIAFLCTLGLETLVHKHYYTALVAAVAIACLLRGWRAGAAALASGSWAVALLMPPSFRMEIDTPGELLTLLVFAFTGGMICLIAFANDRGRRELRIAESQRQSTQKWLETAQQFTRFWTWEIDPERKLVKWVNPYVVLKTQVYEPLESWMVRLHPGDRANWLAAMEEARYSNSFELQFRVRDTVHDRFFVAKGMMTDDPATLERRLVGISVEMHSPSTALPLHEESQFALYGVQDMLDSLLENPSLDRRAQRNLRMAQETIERLLPRPTPARRRAV
jgi:K+-sensing histidine kinase KdpD